MRSAFSGGIGTERSDLPFRAKRFASQKPHPTFISAYKSRASTDWPAPTCASPSKVVRRRGRRPRGTSKPKETSMAPLRPYWKGYLKLSLVSCPIALYTGTHRPSGSHFVRSTRRPAIGCGSNWSTRSRAKRSRRRTRAAATSTRRTPISRWMTTNSTPSRSKATTPSKSTRSSRASRSTAISGQPLLHRTKRSGRPGGLCGNP